MCWNYWSFTSHGASFPPPVVTSGWIVIHHALLFGVFIGLHDTVSSFPGGDTWSCFNLISQVNQTSTFYSLHFPSFFAHEEGFCLLLHLIYSAFVGERLVFVSRHGHVTGNGGSLSVFLGRCRSPGWSHVRCLGRVQTLRVSWHSHILLVKCWITLSEMSTF